jgi:hypothetical protein
MRLSVLVVASAALVAAGPAFGQRPGAPQKPLVVAVRALAQQAPPAGWRTQTIANGIVAAIGVGTIGGATHVVGVACSAEKVPEIAHAVHGGQGRPRALIADVDGTLMAYPFDPAGGTATGADALLFDAGGAFHLDEEVFPKTGAQEAITTARENCEKRGWEYGEDHQRQIIWQLRPKSRGGPELLHAKPSTGWLVVQIACERRSKALVVSSTVLPPNSRQGMAASLTLRVAGQDFSAGGKVQTFQGGDIEGFLTARYPQPRPLFDRLRDARELTLQTGGKRETVPARGLAALLPRFEAACGL